MYFGRFEHRLNSKNQVAIPATLREVARREAGEGGSFYLVVDPKRGCLNLYTQTGIERLAERLRGSSQAAAADFRRLFNARVSPVACDPQGRIVVPAELKETTGLERDGVIVGNGDRVELWAAGRWAEFERTKDEHYPRQLGEVQEDIFERD